MAQELFPKRMATASGAIAGFAIGTGGVGVTLIGAVADRYGVPAATNLINVLPAIGGLLALLLPLPWKAARPHGRAPPDEDRVVERASWSSRSSETKLTNPASDYIIQIHNING